MAKSSGTPFALDMIGARVAGPHQAREPLAQGCASPCRYCSGSRPGRGCRPYIVAVLFRLRSAHASHCPVDPLGKFLRARLRLTNMADLENTLRQLHDSEINAGVQTFYDAGMRIWIGDEINGIRAETTINRTHAARLKWPEGLTAASWLHKTALRLYLDSKYAQESTRKA